MIGYYAHHQGSGHVQRARCIAARLAEPTTILTSAPVGASRDGFADHVALADDARDPVHGDPTAGGVLHWAPPGHAGLRRRMATIAAWIERARPSVMVVDVSVEVTALCRAMGVPVVVVAMHGDRTDRAHRLGYDLADALLACWPAEFADPTWPAHWTAKTSFTGAFSRFDGRTAAPRSGGRRRVAVLLGAGGTDVGAAQVAAATAATPDWDWDVLGGSAGWRADPCPVLRDADVVVTHAGENAVAEVAAARTPAVVVPQARPHGEQAAAADLLERAGLAVVRRTWPPPEAWPALLADAAAADGQAWARWCPGDGADRAARCIAEVAERSRTCAPR
ncbi:glycosyltransferase [Pseudonocardia sp. CA-107938]|uniref:glycosyltransferase n=1 Tax=Pseudonocardia sp. CA-107938 TaxID=3240021 RepID=UPI003D9039EB